MDGNQVMFSHELDEVAVVLLDRQDCHKISLIWGSGFSSPRVRWIDHCCLYVVVGPGVLIDVLHTLYPMRMVS